MVMYSKLINSSLYLKCFGNEIFNDTDRSLHNHSNYAIKIPFEWWQVSKNENFKTCTN